MGLKAINLSTILDKEFTPGWLTINENNGLFDSLLVSHVALQELLVDVGVEVRGLIPADLVVVNVDGPKLLQNVHLVLGCVYVWWEVGC